MEDKTIKKMNIWMGKFQKLQIKKKIISRDLKKTYEIYFTITKFENDIGFSLIH